MTAGQEPMPNHRNTMQDPDPFAPPQAARGSVMQYVLFIAALFVAGQILINAALFVRDTRLRSDILDVFWTMEDARASAGAAYDAAYYTAPENRGKAAAEVNAEIERLEDAKVRLVVIKRRNTLFERLDETLVLRAVSNIFLLERFRRLEQFNAAQIALLTTMSHEIKGMLEMYATTLGHREMAGLHEIKSHEAEAMQEYIRNRNAVARALEIPSREELIKEIELKMEKHNTP